MKNKKIITTITALFGSLICGGYVMAQTLGLDETLGAVNEGGSLVSRTNIPTLLGQVIGTGLSLVGVLFFALMLYGGVLWMTAHGNEEQAKKAWNAILAAAIGLAIVLASYTLVNFLFSSVERGGEAPGTNGTTAVQRCISESLIATACTGDGDCGPNAACNTIAGHCVDEFAFECEDASECEEGERCITVQEII